MPAETDDAPVSHRFFHADRGAKLREGQVLTLGPDGYSSFGRYYQKRLVHAQAIGGNINGPDFREFLLDEIRKGDPRFEAYESRFRCFFGANTLDEARWFASRIDPVPTWPVPIVEVFASRFWTLDMNWMDYDCHEREDSSLSLEMHQRGLKYFREYWHSAISNHCPSQGIRNPPRLEVLMALPVTIGKIVGWFQPSPNC